ncbi:MAG: hypothetical protein E7371_02545 [Clostridiales bacterium]|nr:hypothetical protein [Clostridiales bacterium]
MKKMTKRIVGVAFGAALAFTIGAGTYNVLDNQSVIMADAATYTIDMTETISSADWGTVGDYKEAGLYRFWVGGDKTNAWTSGGKCANENANAYLLDYIKVNGKTVAQHREEYAEMLANGGEKKISWTGMSADGLLEGQRIMQPNIADETAGNKATCYAPIFVNFTCHAAANGNAIDMYIPTSYLSEVTSIELSKDLTITNGTDTWGISQDIKWMQNSYGGAKVVGEKTVIETSVTGIDGKYGQEDKSLGFLFSNYEMAPATTAVDKAFLASINYYDYILVDGQKLGALMKQGGQGEVYYNAWGVPFGTRWPEWMKAQGLIDSVQEVTILAGCQFPAYGKADTVYQTTEDVTFTRQPSGAFANPETLMYASDVNVGWAMEAGDKKELYRIDITSDAWQLNPLIPEGQTNPDAFDLAYFDFGSRDLVRKSILLNGKSLYEINTTVDDTDYEYSTSPMKENDTQQNGNDVFKNPTLLEVRGNTLILYIHKNYVNSLCSNFGDTITLTIKADISASDKVNGKVLAEDVTAEVYAVGYTLNLMVGNTKFNEMSVKAGNALDSLPTPEAESLIFAGWVDADGNPAPATMPESVLTLYASWKPVPYTVTVKHLDGTEETLVFGMMKDVENGVLYSADEMVDVLNACLPEETATEGYAFKERVPNVFQMQNYTFTVETVKVVFTITFVGENGEDIGVAPITFTKATIGSLVLPAVPEKEGYTGTWNKTVDRLKLEDVTLTAVYTEAEEPTTTPDSSTDSTADSTTDSTVEDSSSAEEKGGCGSVVGGIACTLTALGVAAVAVLKKKED